MFRRIAAVLILLLGLYAGCVLAWQIDDFQVDIELNKDSSFLVTEKIVANFSDHSKHGIIRNIPLQYQDEKGKSISVAFQILDIYDENGEHWQYDEYRSGSYKVLKIGSPYRTYNSEKTFVIKYKVLGAILFLDEYDELYWNATGTEWDAPINNVRVGVHLPEPLEKTKIKTTAYTGPSGSRSNTASLEIVDQENILFTSGRLPANQGLTIVVGWPKGIVHSLSTINSSMYGGEEAVSYGNQQSYRYDHGPYRGLGSFASFFFISLILLSLPLLTFLIMFWQWKRYGKDPELHKSIIVEYQAPEGIRPAEMGTLIDDKVDMRDISSSIVDLAIRGYIKIVENPKMVFWKSYALVKLKDFNNAQELSLYERTILKGLFKDAQGGDSVSLDNLENKFYQQLEAIRNKIFEGLIGKGFYNKNPEKVVKSYRGIALVFMFIAFFTFVLIPLGISLLLCAAIIFGFAKYMPAKTGKGMDVYGKIMGFEEFLSRTEKDKIQMAERQNIFEKMLPYAISLGISGYWAGLFADIYQQPPAWFAGNYSGGFLMATFMNSLNNSIASMNSTFISRPRSVSSGGGFGGAGSSGGGFGGGGGSSW